MKLNRLLYILALPLIALVFLLVFSWSTSPISGTDCAYDSAFYMLVGRAMNHSYLPYRDFFEMKGPCFYFIEALGQFIRDGRAGCFILQFVNLSLTLFLCCGILSAVGVKQRIVRLITLCVCLVPLCASFQAGNLTEEFSLPALSLSLFLGLKFFCGDSRVHKPLWAFIQGAAFAYLALVRLTNAYLVCAVVAAIVIELMLQKEFKNLLQNAVCFILGVLAAAAPFVIYYASKRMLGLLIETSFGFGFKYSGGQTLYEHVRAIFKNIRYILPFVCALGCAFFCAKSRREKLFIVIALAAGVAAVSLGGNGYMFLHYYTVLLPLLVYGAARILTAVKFRRILAVICVIGFLMPAPEIYAGLSTALSHIVHKDAYNARALALESAACIPETEKDSILCWCVEPAWYFYTETVPALRYCGWQKTYSRLDPQVEADIHRLYNEDTPIWLVISSRAADTPEYLLDGRTEVFDNNYYKVLRLEEK